MSAGAPDFRFGLIGLGFGRNLADTVAQMSGARLVAVADRSPRRDTAGIAASYGANAYPDGLSLARDAAIDGLIVATPPHGRDGVIEAAAERGLPVFVEKPAGASPADIRGLIDRLGDRASRVMTGFSFRFHEPVRRLLVELEAGLGPVRIADGSYMFDWLPPADSWQWDADKGGGFFNENSCHLVDVLCRIMGAPVRVHAMLNDDPARPSPTAGVVTLQFGDGGLATLALGGIAVKPFAAFPSLTLICRDGQAVLEGRDHMWVALNWASRGDDAVRRMTHEPERLGATRYTAALQHFIAAARSGAPFETTLRDGLLTASVADAMTRSHRLGRPVALNQDWEIVA